MATVLVVAAPTFAALSAKSYVSDGLIGVWDAKEFVRCTVAADKNYVGWRPVVGGSDTILLPVVSPAIATNEFGVMATRGTSRSGSLNGTATQAAFNSANYTVEVAFKQDEEVTDELKSDKRATYCLLWEDDCRIGAINNNTYRFCGNFSDKKDLTLSAGATTVGAHTLSCAQDDTTGSLMLDGGASSVSAAKTQRWTSVGTARGFVYNGGGYGEGSLGMTGTYQSFRFYNRKLTDGERYLNNAIDAIRYRGADASDFTSMPDGWRFEMEGGDVKLYRRVTVGVQNDVGGTVEVNGSSELDGIWSEKGAATTYQLKAIPADGYVFSAWVTTQEATGILTTAETTLTTAGDIYAVFQRDDRDPLTYTLQASTTWKEASWTDENGTPGSPRAADSAIIPSGMTLLVPESTPALAGLTVSGTLVCSNWETCVRAESVTIDGKVTVACPSTDTLTNRVWIACDNLTLTAAGTIDVEGLGWWANVAIGSSAGSYGPGRFISPNPNRGSAAHGGYGAFIFYVERNAVVPASTYDDACAPLLPGSAGSINDVWGNPTSGGGAVRIAATGDVTINGTIYASAGVAGTRGKIANRGTAGSGGSVYITCSTIAGSGKIEANGGSCDTLYNRLYGQEYQISAPGGGGMIAIDYDPAEQTADAVAGLRVSADRGYYAADTSGKYPDRSGESYQHQEADLGTVYFTDDTLLPALLGKTLTGSLVNNGFACAGDLDFAAGHVRFVKPDATVAIGGSLSITGATARLEVGGSTNAYVKKIAGWYLRGAARPLTLTVGGDLTLAKGGMLDVRGAITNGTDVTGGLVSVGGTMTVATSATVRVWSDPVNLGSPSFAVGALTVAEGGVISAWAGGGGAGFGDWPEHLACGPGRGNVGGTGGGHGGFGGFRDSHYGAASPTTMGGATYDDEYRPSLPGSGGAMSAKGGCRGGGIVRIRAEKTICVNGTISADGENCPETDTSNRSTFGGGSGGTILLEAKTVRGSETGLLTAKGGDTHYVVNQSGVLTNFYFACSGGGGRIAVWQCGRPYSPTLGPNSVQRFTSMPAVFAYFGRVTAAAGVLPSGIAAEFASREEYEAICGGKDGTVRWGTISPIPGFVLQLR